MFAGFLKHTHTHTFIGLSGSGRCENLTLSFHDYKEQDFVFARHSHSQITTGVISVWRLEHLAKYLEIGKYT